MATIQVLKSYLGIVENKFNELTSIQDIEQAKTLATEIRLIFYTMYKEMLNLNSGELVVFLPNLKSTAQSILNQEEINNFPNLKMFLNALVQALSAPNLSDQRFGVAKMQNMLNTRKHQEVVFADHDNPMSKQNPEQNTSPIMKHVNEYAKQKLQGPTLTSLNTKSENLNKLVKLANKLNKKYLFD